MEIKVARIEVVGVAAGQLLIDAAGSDIKAGDKVVVSPMVEVYDGLAVEVKGPKK